MSLLIGLTGGIACGKSAVSARLAEKGAIIVDADQIAREVLAPHSEGLKQVIKQWGEDILNEQGELDRGKLGTLVFSDAQARKVLESITHPLIAQESQNQIAKAQTLAAPLIVYDAALLIEAGRAEHFRPLVVVTTTEAIQQARIEARDGLSAEQAHARVKAQLSLKEKEALADYVIYNDRDWQHLEQQIDELWKRLLS